MKNGHVTWKYSISFLIFVLWGFGGSHGLTAFHLYFVVVDSLTVEPGWL